MYKERVEMSHVKHQRILYACAKSVASVSRVLFLISVNRYILEIYIKEGRFGMIANESIFTKLVLIFLFMGKLKSASGSVFSCCLEHPLVAFGWYFLLSGRVVVYLVHSPFSVLWKLFWWNSIDHSSFVGA